MRSKKSKQKKYSKFRLLLDSAFAKSQVFKKTCKKASVKHICHDFNLSPQTEDQEIYNLASQENMFVVTVDLGFKKLIRKNAAGVFVLNSGLSNEEMDTILSNFISGKNPQDYYGKIVKVK